MKAYQQCTRCIMDNSSDDTIIFDENGYCNYCTNALNQKEQKYFPNDVGKKQIEALVATLKKENKNKKFDCIMGLSGGLDSSYLAYLGSAKWNLRILGVHINDGYDTEISKKNITKLCEKANIELRTISPDKEQFDELTRAFVLAGVPNIAMPQDNILYAVLYQFAKKEGIKYFLSGGNFALESILQKGNTHNAYDVVNIKDIFKRHGRGSIRKLKFYSDFRNDIDVLLLKLKSPRPLDWIDYNKEKAFKELSEFCGFEYYGNKHLENSFTKFVQLYWFPKRFNVDKRKAHYSSLIISNQLNREEALALIKKPVDEELFDEEVSYILERLDLTKDQLDEIMKSPLRGHASYRTSLYSKLRANLLLPLYNRVRSI